MGVVIWVLVVYHKCHENFLSNVLEWFHHKLANQICPNETLIRLPQCWEMPKLYWSETSIINFYIIQTSCCSQLPHWIKWLLTLHIRLMVFEITCRNFGTGYVTVRKNTAKVAKPNFEEYATPSLYIRSMHLHTEQVNENFRKN